MGGLLNQKTKKHSSYKLKN